MLNIKILRYKKSYDFKNNPSLPDGFENNWKNNSLDWLVLCDDKGELFRCHCQSVANYCFGESNQVARTIADLEGRERLETSDITEAIGYRNLDRNNWAERGF